MHFFIGVLLVVAGGALEGLFSLPVTRTPNWRWENIWGLGSLAALLLVPWPVALATVPNLCEVYRSTPPHILVLTLLLGFGWGLGGIFWGKAIAAVGMALGISLLMGLLNVFGSPVLLAFTKGPAKLLEPGGLVLLAAVTIMVCGVAVCALAGAWKNKELRAEVSSGTKDAASAPFLIGLGFCVVSAVLSAMVNFGFVYGEPIKQAALQMHAMPAAAPNAIWALVFTGNYLVNTIYAFCVMSKNGTTRRITSQGSMGYWLWALFMGIAWPLGIILYGIGADRMGSYGAFVAFPMMLVTAILFGNLAGALTGEWRGTSQRTKTAMVAGVLVLTAAFAVFGIASRLLSQ
jgi:L-rhamnose-H+ transport protein